ncbi:hypothetical protein [Marivirga sp.]|uniref:hypothetical protein n=1 Tax=Marivirga sp. TaxID=2018662 RepID=UPI003DA6DDC9
MIKFNKFFTYSLAIIGLFSLTAISCEDTDDLLNVDVPTDIKRSFDITTNEAKDTSFTETVNPSEEEIDEYKDRIKNISADKLIINVTDNGSDGNTGSGEIILISEYGDFSFLTIDDLNELDGIEIELTGDLQEAIINSLEAFESFDIQLDLASDGSIDYTVDITIEGVITASPVSSN